MRWWIKWRKVVECCGGKGKWCNLGRCLEKGSKFTWTNCQHDGSFINERLNHGIANKAWCDIHKIIEIRVSTECTYDHKPLLLQVHDTDHPQVFFKKGFKVEASWMHDEEYDDIFKEVWMDMEGVDPDVGLKMQKLVGCQTKLTNWSTRKLEMQKRNLKGKQNSLRSSNGMRRFTIGKKFKGYKGRLSPS
jgi:hypothetical protein